MITAESQTIFIFSDGAVWLEFDAAADDSRNAELAKALQAEGRRRRKIGLATAGTLRVRKPDDVLNDCDF